LESDGGHSKMDVLRGEVRIAGPSLIFFLKSKTVIPSPSVTLNWVPLQVSFVSQVVPRTLPIPPPPEVE
jgi:hypothetical protein